MLFSKITSIKLVNEYSNLGVKIKFTHPDGTKGGGTMALGYFIDQLNNKELLAGIEKIEGIDGKKHWIFTGIYK